MAMSGDLEGENAFRIVLDRVVEETREAHVAREKCGDLQGDLQNAEKKAEELERQLGIVRADLKKREDGDQSLGVLHQQAGLARNALENLVPSSVPQHQVASIRTLVENLSAALKAAEDYCDPIPF